MRRQIPLLAVSLCVLWGVLCASPASAQPCTGLCLQQVTCPAGGTTSISGRVFAPNGVDPLPNVLVYVPNAAVQPFAPGVVCAPGGQEASGDPLVQTTTNVDGTFTLTNMPVGSNIPLVIQAGRWRRQVTVSTVSACSNTPVNAALTRFPRNRSEGDIPKIALVTGAVDATECVLRKIGIQDSEFNNPGGANRIQLYRGGGYSGAQINASTPLDSVLYSSQAALNQYDMTMLSCEGDEFVRSAAERQRLLNYANAGGRIFATHFEYSWLYSTPPFSATALWSVNQPVGIPDQNAFVNQGFAKGQQLAQWLQTVSASSVLGRIPLQTIRQDQNGVVAPTQSWLTINDPTYGPEDVSFTFNTPVGAAANQQCGRVLYNEYHVENVVNSAGYTFPSECVAGPMTAQEKLLEYMLFDLSTFVAPDIPATVSIGFSNAPPSFTQGDAGDTAIISVTNTNATLATDTTLTLSAAIPNGLTAVSMAGSNPGTTGWACSLATTSCTRTTVLAGGANDPITLVLAVAPNAPVGSGPVILTATASGGGLAANVVAHDPITITGVATISWSNPAAVIYGAGLGGTQLNATASTAGTFVYNPPAGTVLPAGTHTLGVTFTADDTVNYPAPATASVQLQVDQATPAVTWATPAPVIYGTALGAAQLNATADVPGTFGYTPAAGAVLSTGPQPLSVIFTPADAVNYTSASAGVTLTVNHATPVITWGNPSAITYGAALTGVQLNATADAAGTFAYAPPLGTVLPAGTHTLEVVFTPTDLLNYCEQSATVTLVVNRATPVLTWNTPAAIVYGTALGGAQLNATANVAGTFSYLPAAGTTLNAGSQALSVTFAPADAVNYNGASGGVTLSVLKATPTLSWSNPADLVYPTALGATQLNATASVPGTFVYSPAAGAVLNPGAAQALSVTFTPADALNYQVVSSSVSINVVTSPAVINGMPGISCSIWPPNGKLVEVATISASAIAGGVSSFTVTATSNEPISAGDILISGSGVQPRVVQLRAARAGKNAGRIYTITAKATNVAGLVTTATATCTVPHDQGK